VASEVFEKELKEKIDDEIKRAKEKLKAETITKFTYATMQELNQKNLEDNTNKRKKIWNEVAECVNTISDNLNLLKDAYNQKTEIEDAAEIIEGAKK
jgi:hypothetical protein